MSTPQALHDIRPSPIAGTWYPAHPGHLASSVDAYIQQAEIPAIDGRIIGILVPHAGHRYSGPVAGYAYKTLQGLEVDVVALIGPSHRRYPGLVLTSGHEAYGTPLGLVPLDRAVLESVHGQVPLHAVREDSEHSLEIELPFLQRVLGDFRLVPLALIDQSLPMAERLGAALADALRGQKALLVASSDLSHFFPQAVAHQLDQKVLNAVADYDPAGVIAAEEYGQKLACGHGAIATVMIAARALGADTSVVLRHATSGDVTQDYAQVVGYASAIFYQRTTSIQ